MESKPEEETKQKHEQLDEINKDATDQVELIKNKFTDNIASPFINQSKSWSDETQFQIPEDIRRNIEDELNFVKPSNIQAYSIPLIVAEPYHDLIAQARNGCGKTGSFAIGSTLRVDRSNKNCQILVIANTRELVNQIHSVYEKITKGTEITLANFNFEDTSPK